MEAAGSSILMPVWRGITGGQPLVIGKIAERKRTSLLAGELVELGVSVAVGGEDVFGVEALAVGISLGLLHSLERVFVLLLCFEDRDGQGLEPSGSFDAEEIVGFAWTGPAPSLGAGWLHGRRSFQSDVRHAIALVPEDRVDQLISCFSFVPIHDAFGLNNIPMGRQARKSMVT